MTSLALWALAIWAGTAHSEGPCGSWNAVPMPGADGNGLASVSASSASDVWAVWKAAYHWNGSAWSQTAMPGLGSPDTVVRAVTTAGPGDAWVAGYTSFLGSPQTMVQHWDGVRWSVVPSPVIAGGSFFDAIVALSSGDVWAVGARAGGLPEFQAVRVTLTAHWDGTRWTAVPSPNIANRSHELLDVDGIASNDVWAVGSYRNLTQNYQTLILHWNGSSWSIVPSPNLPGENVLHGVSARAANDVWAVGEAWDGVTSRQIFLHWNGSSWRQIDGPGGPTACAGCTGDVLAMGPDDVWAVGSTIGHWNGAQWSLAPNPEVPGALGLTLRSIAQVGACDAWAVGGSFDAEGIENALSVRLTPGGGAVNQSPIAVASASPASGPGPLEVHFSSAGSVDHDGTIVSYLWDFGDSSDPPNRHDPNPVHTFLQTGALTYHVTLQVRDDQGAFAQSSVVVRITPPLHVESQEVSQHTTAGASVGRDLVTITDRDRTPMAGAVVTARYLGPSSGIAIGTTSADGRVLLETSPSGSASASWCFEVLDVAKTGCIYVPAANVVTEQCESGSVAAGSGTVSALALRASPNPFAEDCAIELALPVAQTVRVTIHDPSGRQVRELHAAPLPAGRHVLGWDGRDTGGQAVRAGVYFVTAQVGERRIATRVQRTR